MVFEPSIEDLRRVLLQRDYVVISDLQAGVPISTLRGLANDAVISREYDSVSIFGEGSCRLPGIRWNDSQRNYDAMIRDTGLSLPSDPSRRLTALSLGAFTGLGRGDQQIGAAELVVEITELEAATVGFYADARIKALCSQGGVLLPLQKTEPLEFAARAQEGLSKEGCWDVLNGLGMKPAFDELVGIAYQLLYS